MLNLIVARRACLLSAVAMLAVACTRDLDAPPARTAPTVSGLRIAGVVEITFRDIGSPKMTSSAIVGSTVAEVEALRAAQTLSGPGGRAQFDLTVPQIATGTPGDQTIQIRLDANGASSDLANGARYFHATYDVRNAQLDGTPFGTPRHNLTFIAVGETGRTIGDSPLTVFDHDGTPITDPSVIHQLKPSGLVGLNGADALVPISPDILQVFTEAEIAAIGEGSTAPTDVTNIFPYGFVVHNRLTPTTTRELPGDPPANQFDGVVSFAYRMPLRTTVGNNPTTVTVLMLALDDSRVRVTQSLEEQTIAGGDSVTQRAASLGATQIRLLGGVTLGSTPTPTSLDTLFCSVRTAGPANAATAHLVKGADFASLDPNPYAMDGSGNHILNNAGFHATFDATVENPTSSNFVVRGLISGQHFRGGTYTGSGTPTVSTPSPTPAGAFLAGEQVEVALTTGLACPRPWVGRLTVGATTGNGSLQQVMPVEVGSAPHGLAVGDFDRDGHLDLAVVNSDANTVTVAFGNPAGEFGMRRSFPVSPGVGPQAIVAADFNGDGILDLATANASSNNVSILLGHADGSFGSATVIAAGSGANGLAVGDLNGDGVPDLVVADATGGGGVFILLGNGDGTFRSAPAVTTGAVSLAVAVGDVNQDGILDFVVAAQGIGIEVFLGHGDGTFTLRETIANPNVGLSLALGDLNGDGRLDLAVAPLLTGLPIFTDLEVLTGNGDGTFTPSTALSLAENLGTVVAIADLNHDGRLDLVVNQPHTTSVFLNTGSGFGPRTDFDNGNTPTNQPLVTVDLNGDGAIDVLVPNNLGAATHIALFHGNP